MRKIQLVLAIALMGLVTFSGCKKKSDSAPSYTMSAKVDGAAVNLSLCAASVSAGSLIITGVTVTGGTGGVPSISIYIPTWNSAAGTFSLSDSIGTGPTAIYSATASSAFTSTSGTVVLTSVSATTITGTFSFSGTDGLLPPATKSITAGTFTAKR